jgi:hypothetical protein
MARFDMESRFTKVGKVGGVKCAVVEAREILEDEEDLQKAKMVNYFDLENQRVLKIAGNSRKVEFEAEFVYEK